MKPDFAAEDLRAAVAAGVLTEEQATKLRVLVEERHGYRSAMAEDEEPFEFFRGFSEIFVAVGIGILFSGIFFLVALILIGIFGANAGVASGIAAAALAWIFAEYFTRRRRMSLPSILLATIFAFSISSAAGLAVFDEGIGITRTPIWTSGVGFAAMLIYFWRFRLPFVMFLLGIFGIGIVFSGTGVFTSGLLSLATETPIRALFDLSTGSRASLATLTFGLAAFAVAMAFDLRDPHRISRFSASAFWLHVLAAPALVNTIATTLYNSGGALGYALTVCALAFVTIVALIIDRRSFLTAGLAYFAILLSLALENTGTDWDFVGTLLILGAFITLVGSGWSSIRSIIMRALPNFPLKNRLPPYSETP